MTDAKGWVETFDVDTPRELDGLGEFYKQAGVSSVVIHPGRIVNSETGPQCHPTRIVVTHNEAPGHLSFLRRQEWLLKYILAFIILVLLFGSPEKPLAEVARNVTRTL